mmetsp:Transcript_99338/g.285353  ORF Transcript_99338/g.285353 Transcript_99338/m.285353 type:complete len:277 (-) Transcript_99338:1569-2399(-)
MDVHDDLHHPHLVDEDLHLDHDAYEDRHHDDHDGLPLRRGRPAQLVRAQEVLVLRVEGHRLHDDHNPALHLPRGPRLVGRPREAGLVLPLRGQGLPAHHHRAVHVRHQVGGRGVHMVTGKEDVVLPHARRRLPAALGLRLRGRLCQLGERLVCGQAGLVLHPPGQGLQDHDPEPRLRLYRGPGHVAAHMVQREAGLVLQARGSRLLPLRPRLGDLAGRLGAREEGLVLPPLRQGLRPGAAFHGLRSLVGLAGRRLRRGQEGVVLPPQEPVVRQPLA